VLPARVLRTNYNTPANRAVLDGSFGPDSGVRQRLLPQKLVSQQLTGQCAEVLRRMGAKIGEDDPAFLLVEMNRLEVEEAVSAVVERLTPLPGTTEQAGWALAKEVATAAASVVDVKFAAARETTAKEAETARAAAARAISELAQAQPRVTRASPTRLRKRRRSIRPSPSRVKSYR
jgi:hypothetical protein